MKKGKVLTIILVSLLLIALVGSVALNFKPEESSKKPDSGIVDTIPDDGNEGTETPDVPDEPELLKRIELTSNNVFYENSSGVDSGSYRWIVTTEDVPVANDNIDGNVLKMKWRSGNTLSVDVDLSNYDVANATHLTFWVGSDAMSFSDGYAKFVQDYSKTIFNSGKYFKSSDIDLDEYLTANPNKNPDDYLKFGEWKKYEIPIADVLEFYETNGRITFFHLMSSGLTVNNFYLAKVQFETIETVAE